MYRELSVADAQENRPNLTLKTLELKQLFSGKLTAHYPT